MLNAFSLFRKMIVENLSRIWFLCNLISRYVTRAKFRSGAFCLSTSLSRYLSSSFSPFFSFSKVVMRHGQLNCMETVSEAFRVGLTFACRSMLNNSITHLHPPATLLLIASVAEWQKLNYSQEMKRRCCCTMLQIFFSLR